eukprot:contig_21254_g5222
MEQMNPSAVDEGTGAKEETVDDVEELYYETLLTANGGTDAEGDTESGFEEGPNALDALGLYINNVDNILKCDKRGIATPLTRKDGHIYLEWSKGVDYTTGEL